MFLAGEANLAPEIGHGFTLSTRDFQNCCVMNQSCGGPAVVSLAVDSDPISVADSDQFGADTALLRF